MKNLSVHIIMTAAVVCVFLFGCGRREKGDSSKPTIALALKTLNNPFFIDMEKGGRQAAAKLPINLVVQGGEREMDVEKQMQIVENLIQRGVDAICLVPTGSKEIVPAIVKANRANIPVLILERDPGSARVQIFEIVGPRIHGVDGEIRSDLAGTRFGFDLGR